MIQHFLITVLVIYGIHAITRDGMLLGGLYMKILFILSKRIKHPEKILKPLFDCTPCMASVYGTISYVLYIGFTDPLTYVVWVFSLCGFNYILNKVLNK